MNMTLVQVKPCNSIAPLTALLFRHFSVTTALLEKSSPVLRLCQWHTTHTIMRSVMPNTKTNLDLFQPRRRYSDGTQRELVLARECRRAQAFVLYSSFEGIAGDRT